MRRVRDIVPTALGDEVEALLADVRDTGEPRTGIEIDGTTPAVPGERRTWVASFYPMRLPEGRRVGVVVVDITDRRRAQEALSESERVPWRVRLHDRASIDYDVHVVVARKRSASTSC